MRYARLGCLVLLGSLLFAGSQDSDINVNTRYTVETVIVAGKGWRTDLQSETNDRLSAGLRSDLLSLIGYRLNPSVLDSLAARLRKEFSAREVTHRLLRGESPDHVRVEFDVKPVRASVDVSVNQFLYNSKEGWTGSGEAGFTVRQNSFAFGLASDGDTLPERYSGIFATYQNKHLGTDRVNLRFRFESYHEQWNSATLDALAGNPGDISGVYRSRQAFEPSASVALAKPLTFEVGARFERFDNQYPSAHTEAANSMTAALRYHHRFEGAENQQDVDASYAIAAATRMLESDFVYTSNYLAFRYQFMRGKHMLSDDFAVGVIYGRAPLDDRFVLGNSYRLRGWNKYDIDPLGGNRIAYNSVEYRYGPFKAFYDTGAIWDDGQPAVPRHSLGVGVRESVFTLAVAFPLRSGHIEPIFMMGMIY
jgi:hypothetical protein